MKLSELRQLAASGELRPADQVRHGEHGKWIGAGKTPALYQSFDLPSQSEGATSVNMAGAVLDYLRHPSKLWQLLWKLWNSSVARYLPGSGYEVDTRGESQEMTLAEIREGILAGRLSRDTKVRTQGVDPSSPLAQWRTVGEGLALESFRIGVLYHPLGAHIVLGIVVYAVSLSLILSLSFIPFVPLLPVIAALPIAYGTWDVVAAGKRAFSDSGTWRSKIAVVALAAPVGLLLILSLIGTAILLLAIALSAALIAPLGVFINSKNPVVRIPSIVIFGPFVMAVVVNVIPFAFLLLVILLGGALAGGAIGLLCYPWLPKPLPFPGSECRNSEPLWAWLLSGGGLAVGMLWQVVMCGGMIAVSLNNPARDFANFQSSVAVKPSGGYFVVTTTGNFPSGEVQWEGSLQDIQLAGDTRLLLFSDLELPKPLEVRFICAKDDIEHWTRHLGKKTRFKGQLSQELVAGYGGPPMRGPGPALHKRIVFDQLERFPLQRGGSVDISEDFRRSSPKIVKLEVLMLTVRSVKPL